MLEMPKKDRQINIRVPGNLLRSYKTYVALKKLTVSQSLIAHMLSDLKKEKSRGG